MVISTWCLIDDCGTSTYYLAFDSLSVRENHAMLMRIPLHTLTHSTTVYRVIE